jgi:hypothetical protein
MADRKILYMNVGWFGYDIDQYLGETDDLDYAVSDVQAAAVEIEKVSFNELTRALKFDVVGTFYADYSSDMGINAYILEDSIIGYQVAAPDPNNYAHNHVLREMLGGPWGNNFTMADVNTSDNTYRESFTYVVPVGYDENQLSFIGFIQKQNSSIHKRDIINCTPPYTIEEGITLTTEEGTLNTLDIFPNPTSGIVYISIPQETSGTAEILIKDLSGKIILRTESSSKSMVKIDAADFSAGIYLVQLTDGQNQIFVQKLVIQ